MSAVTLFFYMFSGIMIASAFMVIASRNPVHSVLFLILTFVNAAGLFLILGAEFLAMILIVVYVGAVAVLFLFVVMMLDVDFVELRQGFLQYLPFGGLIAAIFLLELLLVAGTWTLAIEAIPVVKANAMPEPMNTRQLGRVLYTQYIYFFQTAGFVLLVAMVGAIVLTLRDRVGVKRQNIAQQNARTPETGMELLKVPSRVGVTAPAKTVNQETRKGA
jgi:NADH-quinone oxidoreductase subunit J